MHEPKWRRCELRIYIFCHSVTKPKHLSRISSSRIHHTKRLASSTALRWLLHCTQRAQLVTDGAYITIFQFRNTLHSRSYQSSNNNNDTRSEKKRTITLHDIGSVNDTELTANKISHFEWNSSLCRILLSFFFLLHFLSPVLSPTSSTVMRMHLVLVWNTRYAHVADNFFPSGDDKNEYHENI